MLSACVLLPLAGIVKLCDFNKHHYDK